MAADNSKMPPSVKAIIAVVIAALVMRMILAIVTHNAPDSISICPIAAPQTGLTLLCMGLFSIFRPSLAARRQNEAMPDPKRRSCKRLRREPVPRHQAAAATTRLRPSCLAR
jgi:hypothetical protein